MKEKKGIIIIELKGFSEIATSLLYRMEKIKLKETQIRLKYRNIICDIINKSAGLHNYIEIKEIGGDTWYITYKNMRTALESAYYIMHLAYQEVIKTGLFYIKPVIAVGEASPVFEGARFVDNDSINIYRIADFGDPFSLYVYNYTTIKDINIVNEPLNSKLIDLKQRIEFQEIDWKSKSYTDEQLTLSSSFYLSSLLPENDIAYFQTIEESYARFIELQNESKNIHIYGGCVKYKDEISDEYVKSIFELFQNKQSKSHVICYIDPKYSKINSYYWLRISQILSETFPDRYIFSFYEIDMKKVKPLSYHIYNEEYVLINLRDYSPQINKTTLNSSVLIRNQVLAKRFIVEFLENFRNIRYSGNVNAKINKYIQSIKISEKKKKEIDHNISSLIGSYL